MKRPLRTLASLILCLVHPICLARTPYVITNNDNLAGNSATIYRLDPNNGMLRYLTSLPTGGFGQGIGFFATASVGVTAKAGEGCIFIYDGGSSDIAAFRVDTTTFDIVNVGNFSNPAVVSYMSNSMSVTPNGRFLYADYNVSKNVGAWSVGSDCSLTFINAYQASVGADKYAGIKVTPDGKGLLLAVPNFAAAEMFRINGDGTLTDLGFANFASLADCSTIGCSPSAIDVTADSKLAFFGNANVNQVSVLAASITPGGLKNETVIKLNNTGNLSTNANVPFLNAAGYHGAGALFLGICGGGPGTQPGIVTTVFSEGRRTVRVIAATPIESPEQVDGLIASAGKFMVISEWPNVLQVFTINPDGTLTPTAQGPVINENGDGVYSFSIFPESR